MQNITRFILTFFIAIPLVFGFGSQTVKQIDEIKNNTGTDILLNPTDKVDINYFTGEKALQSTVDGELEESAVTNTELGYMSGVTSSVQTQIDSKTPLTRLINTTTPLQGGGDLTADRTLSILQSGAAQDGYLSQADWNTFNDKQDAITGTNGDLYYWNSGLSNLAIGTNGQILQVSALGFPEWADLPPSVSVTTKGDLQTYSTAPDRLPVGTDGQVLQANSATSTGLEWIDPNFYTSPLTTQGDILYRDATQDTRLGIGTEGQLLTVTSGEPAWQDAPVTLPSQTGNEGLYLTTNGTNASWNEINEDKNEIKNNFLECSGFDGCTQEGTITNGAGVDASSIVARTTETTAFNPSKLNLSQSLAGALDYTYTKTANYDSKQLVAYCEIKTANTGVTFSAGADSVQAGSLTVSSDDSWKYYKIPLVGGATDQYFKIDHSDAATIPDIDVDNCFIGKSTEAIELGQAHFVGSLLWNANANCVWITANTNTWVDMNIDNDCLSESTGAVQEPDTKIPAVKIINPRTDGEYKVSFSGLMYRQGGTGACRYSLSSTGSYDNQGVAYLDSDGYNINSLHGSFRFNDTSAKTVRVISKDNTNTCALYGRSSDDLQSKFTVHFFPDDNATVVAQASQFDPDKAGFVQFSAGDFGESATWKKADGQCLLKTDYPDYMANVGTLYGECTVTTTNDGFNVPDLVTDNRFIRASGGSLALGTTQAQSIESHRHNGGYPRANGFAYTNSLYGSFTGGTVSTSSQANGTYTGRYAYTSNYGGTETRPNNIAFVPYVRMENASNMIIGKFEQVEEVNKTLTASEVNTFSFEASLTGVVSRDDFDFINGNASTSSGTNTEIYDYTFNSGLFTEAPNCNANARIAFGSLGDRQCNVTATTTTGVQVGCTQNGTATAYPHTVICNRGGDSNKNLSGVIINASKAKQEISDIVRQDIVSSDLSQVIAYRSTALTPFASGTQTVVYDTEVKDVNNNYNTSTGLYTAQRDQTVLVCPKVLWDNASWALNERYQMRLNTFNPSKVVEIDRHEITITQTNYYDNGKCKVIDLVQGQSFSVEINHNSTASKGLISSPNEYGYNTLSIQELPDTESVLKSLVNETLTKCQTKVLSADVTANGVITDWVYSNLTVGKKYKFMVTPQYNYTTSALNDKRGRIDMSGAWVKVVFNRWWAYGQAELNTSTTISPVFIAQTTTLTPTLFERANANISTGSISQLCELPDTYVDTTEF